MGYVGYEPARKPLTSADITDSVVTSAKIVDGTIALADLSATGTKDSTTFLRGDNSFATVSSDYVLLATTDASSSASVSFDGYFSSTYKNYKLIISSMIPATDGQTFRMRYRISNADVTASNYISSIDSSYTNSSAGGNDYDRVWNADSFRISGSAVQNSDSLSSLNGEFTFYNSLGTSYKKCFTFIGTSNASGTTFFNYNSSGVYTGSTSALSGVTFFMSSGNITIGNFKLYGIK